MKKIVLTYGLLSGAISGLLMACTMPLWKNGIITMDNGMVFGYATMIVALSLIFFAVKNFRDRHNAGVVSFGKALGIGLLITLIAAVGYAVAWEISLKTVASDFMSMYSDGYLQQAIDSGADEKRLTEVKKEIEDFKVMYANPLIRFPMTMMEIIPVGVLISLISALVLRKKD